MLKPIYHKFANLIKHNHTNSQRHSIITIRLHLPVAHSSRLRRCSTSPLTPISDAVGAVSPPHLLHYIIRAFRVFRVFRDSVPPTPPLQPHRCDTSYITSSTTQIHPTPYSKTPTLQPQGFESPQQHPTHS